jgi:hypothetical protein
VLERRGVQVPVDVAEPQRGRELEEALLLAGERDARGSLATNSTRSWVSQIAKANMPRRREVAAGPQWW